MEKRKIHELSCQLKHDFFSGVLGGWKKIIPFVAIILSLCVYFSVSCAELEKIGFVKGSPTIADTLIYIFRGMRPYNPKIELQFEIPIAWLMIQLYIAFVIGNYATQDMSGYGQQFLLRATTKKQWFIGKCFFCITNVLAYYGIVYAVIIAYSVVTGNLSFTLTQDICGIMSELDTSLFNNLSFILNIIVLPILTSVIMALLQLLLSLHIKPTLSYAYVMVYQILSAYYVSYLLLGNYSMVLRCKPFLADGIDTLFALIIETIVIVGIIFIGIVSIQKFDYIEKT